MRIAVMKDSKSWIVDKMTDTIKEYAPADVGFTDFDVDIDIKALLRLAKTHDIIYSAFWQPFMRNNLVLDDQFHGNKTVIQVHHLVDEKDKNQLKLCSPTIQHIGYYCRTAQASLSLLGYKGSLYKLNQFVDSKRFENVEPHEPSKIFKIGCFSQNIPRKCFGVLYEALDRMKNVELITTLGPEHEKVRRYGRVPDEELVELFSEIDCYVSTSNCEGGPVGVLEAMGCGVPVVTTNTGFAGDILKHGINGFVIPFYGVDALVKRLEWVRENPGTARIIGESGKMTVAKYTPKAFSKQYINMFRRIKEVCHAGN